MKHSHILSSLRETESQINPSIFMRLKIESFYNLLLNQQRKKTKRINYFKKILIFFIHSYLSLISILNIIRLSLSKTKRIAHFLISIDNNDSPYDARSIFILDLLSPNKTINFFHTGDLLYAFKNSFRVKNAIYFESIVYLRSLFSFWKYKTIRFQWERLGKVAEIEINLFSFIFSLLSIEKFLFIDDSRNSLTALACCKNKKIKSVAYQHARFNEYHLGLAELNYDKYLCWNDYFKNKLIELNSSYKKEDVIVCNHPRIRGVENNNIERTRTIIVLEENYFSYHDVKPYIDLIPDDIQIIYRKKPGLNSKKIKENENLILSEESSIEEDIVKYKPFVLIGSESTLLLESWLFYVPSIAITNSGDYGLHLLRDGLVEACDTPKEIESKLKLIFNLTKEDIIKRKEMLWGKSSPDNLYRKALSELKFI